ncbi:hypothetical protein, partial [Psychromonas sp. MME2]|uniref:hypothetical protein n=1 Tax=Psychromonas sp. MME2 TaxID=3231033 RepID=UPI00339CDD68
VKGGCVPFKQKVHQLFDEMSDEVHEFIKSSESGFSEGWVPLLLLKINWIKRSQHTLRAMNIDNKTGWLFATIARHLQDKDKLLYKKVGSLFIKLVAKLVHLGR